MAPALTASPSRHRECATWMVTFGDIEGTRVRNAEMTDHITR